MKRASEQKIYGTCRHCGTLSVLTLMMCFTLYATSLFANPFSNSEPYSPDGGNQSLFGIEAVGKIAEIPVHWVTAGTGVLAFGAGQAVYIAPEETPDVIVASLTVDRNISEALILGKHAFLSEEGLGLRILSLEDPSNPADLGVYDLPGTIFHLARRGRFIFVGGDGGGVRILESLTPGQETASGIQRISLVER